MSENTIHSVETRTTEVKPRHSFWLPILGAGLLATGGATIYEGMQLQDLKSQLNASQHDSQSLRTNLAQSGEQLKSDLQALHDDLVQTRKSTSEDVANARSLAARHADQVASRIANLQAQENMKFNQALGEVRQTAAETSTKIDGISTDVGSVKTEVASAKSDIQDTRSDLQRARGDMGVMSGLIATNAKEVQMLRDLGDRNIYEFTLNKSNTLTKVGDIQVALRKADPKHNRFTVDVLADDKKVEKKDKNLNEPVQFYTARARQPYELVINQVGKDRVVGYLATPKVAMSR